VKPAYDSGTPRSAPARAAGARPAPAASQTIRAQYRDGVFVPVEPLELEDGADVEISVKRKSE
jgi:hypothetical protein